MTERRNPDHPKPGRFYALTGGPNDRCLSNGDSWSQSVVRCRDCRRRLTSVDIRQGQLCPRCRGKEAA